MQTLFIDFGAEMAHRAHKFHETGPYASNVTRDVTAQVSTDLSLALRN